MILNQTSLDYNKDCTVPFGAYVQVDHKTMKTNSNITRTLDAIYLRPAQNQQGGHEIMDLNSGRMITRNIVHVIPVTDVVIKAVKTMAIAQGFTNLKFKNRHGVIFHHADWIAGVDYDDNNDTNEEDDDETYHHKAKDNESEEELKEQEEIDPNKVDNIISDERENTNPTIHEEGEEPEEPDPLQEQNMDARNVSVTDEEESQATESRRLT